MNIGSKTVPGNEIWQEIAKYQYTNSDSTLTIYQADK